MALRLDLGAPATPAIEPATWQKPIFPSLSFEDKNLLRHALQLMQPWRVSFVSEMWPDAKMGQLEMMGSVSRWEEATCAQVWEQALKIEFGVPSGDLRGHSHKKPHRIILGLCAGMRAMFGETRCEILTNRLLSHLKPQMGLAERSLRLCMMMSCGPRLYEGHPAVERLVVQLLPLAHQTTICNANKSRQRQKELLTQLKTSLGQLNLEEESKDKKSELTASLRRDLIKAQLDGKDAFGPTLRDALDRRSTAGSSVRSWPKAGHAASPRSLALPTPQGMLSRRTSYSSQALGSPWQTTASPFSESEWNLVETSSLNSD